MYYPLTNPIVHIYVYINQIRHLPYIYLYDMLKYMITEKLVTILWNICLSHIYNNSIHIGRYNIPYNSEGKSSIYIILFWRVLDIETDTYIYIGIEYSTDNFAKLIIRVRRACTWDRYLWYNSYISNTYTY